jgi:hypothetical protein
MLLRDGVAVTRSSLPRMPRMARMLRRQADDRCARALAAGSRIGGVPGSDLMVDVIKTLDIKYLPSNPDSRRESRKSPLRFSTSDDHDYVMNTILTTNVVTATFRISSLMRGVF